MTKKLGVLVVDDSPLCRQLIADALTTDPDLEIIATAENGEQAVRKVAELKPDVVTMDVDMPVLDGLGATEQIMASTPVPILVLTADPKNQAPALTHRALAVGALALQVKPPLDAGPAAWNLAREVKLLASVKVIRHLRGGKKAGTSSVPALSPVPSPPAEPMALLGSPVGIIGIGSSTGGPQVVHKLVSELPADFPVPIVVVQHINAAFSEPLGSWLASSSKLKVAVAKDGDLLSPGTVLLAPSHAHLQVSRGRVTLVEAAARDGHLPSATLMLESMAKAYGRRALGVLLTGMGTDGVDGLAAIRAAGGRTVAQNQESSIVWGMPGAAVAKGVVDYVVHGDELAANLTRLVKGQELPRLTP